MSRALRTVVAVFIVLAVFAAVARALAVLKPESAMVRMERRMVVALNHDARLIQAFDSRFAARPALTLLHVVPGALFLTLAPLQFFFFFGGDEVNDVSGNAKCLNDGFVQDPDPTRCDGAHTEFFVSGDAQLSHNEDIKRRAQFPGNLICHGNAAARQGQNKEIRLAFIRLKALTKYVAGLGTIPKIHNGLRSFVLLNFGRSGETSASRMRPCKRSC